MQEHEEWLRIAHEDLIVAKDLLKLERFSPVTYHCQQSAEKFLKGYLVLKKHPIIKTHDLTKLIELCSKFDTGFEKMYDKADALNPFSTRFRYPTEFDIPDKVDAELAIKQAKSIMRFVLKKISIPDRDQSNIFEDK